MKAKGWPVCVPVLTEDDCRKMTADDWAWHMTRLLDASTWSCFHQAIAMSPRSLPEHRKFNNAARFIGYVVTTYVKDAAGNDIDPWGVG